MLTCGCNCLFHLEQNNNDFDSTIQSALMTQLSSEYPDVSFASCMIDAVADKVKTQALEVCFVYAKNTKVSDFQTSLIGGGLFLKFHFFIFLHLSSRPENKIQHFFCFADEEEIKKEIREHLAEADNYKRSIFDDIEDDENGYNYDDDQDANSNSNSHNQNGDDGDDKPPNLDND